METNIEELKNTWHKAKKTSPANSLQIDKLISLAVKKKRSTFIFHLLNILILTLVLIGITAFFDYVGFFHDVISKIGAGLMMGGLAIRIIIEIFSTYKSRRIDLSETAIKTNEDTLLFYNFREKIHGPVTITIVVLYTIGFYMLTPEFSDYFSLPMMILIDGSYIVGAIFLIWQIRKGIRKEMDDLNDLIKLKEDLANDKERNN